jgi:orotate phosphoribosyltransferase
MTQQEIIDIFEKTGVIIHGHFRLTSGRHSDVFLQCSQVMQYPEHAEGICRELAGLFTGTQIDLVIGPALGGIVLAYEVARSLGARAVFAERENGKMTLRRSFTIDRGEKVLVVEDAVSTGGSVNEVAEVVTANGGDIVGIGAFVDRTGGIVSFGVPFCALVTMDIKSYAPAECPHCKSGVPLALPKSAQA